ncbi:MAG: YtxH domain-containing protein [Hymenobacteraceae bacterium]|nr:YtxH domain-containing protein [Hymenobacteraceae bacterium]
MRTKNMSNSGSGSEKMKIADEIDFDKIVPKADSDTGKILLATLAGIGAGIAAGILLAPENGKATRESVMRSLTKASEDVNSTVKRWTENLRSSGRTGSEDELVMHGSWEDVKGQLRANYGELTDEDLEYQQGRENELLERLQRRLGKTRDEIVRIISGR